MKSLAVARSLALAVVAAAAFAAPKASHAGAAEGVTCQNDHPPQFATGVLKCGLNSTQTRNSICPVGTLDPLGDDLCRLAPAPVPPVSESIAELAATDLVIPHETPVRLPNAIARDRFSVTFHDFKFPDGAIFIGDAKNGVKCPSGSTVKRSNDGRTLRCEAQRESAVCVPGFKLQVRNGKDACVIEVNGFVVNQQGTLPSGQISSIGWVLDQDGPSGGSQRDQWVRFTLPVAVGF